MKGWYFRCVDAKRCGCVAFLLRLYTSTRLIFFLLFAFCFLSFTPHPVFAKKAKVSTPHSEYLRQQKALRDFEIEKYKRSLLPQSGYMTAEEYEELSKDIFNSERVVPPRTLPKDVKMKYVPQPTYKLTHYNDPPGSPELHIPRRFQFDRQINCSGIISPNKDIMVYPAVYYYVTNQCTASDLFIIPLDQKLNDVDRVARANVVKRIPAPILSTEKNISEKFTFRTMTPIDFSVDGSKLITKEKIGNINDGIWKTNLWVYDFNTRQAKNLSEIRDAIRFYWMNKENLVLDEKRWDIHPLGFDANNPERIIVSAYGYTGKTPKFLGTWSIDYKGERSMLISLSGSDNVKISVNGFKLTQSGVMNPAEAYSNEKQQDKIAKKNRKEEKKAKKQDFKKKKQALNNRLKEMKKEESQTVKEYQKQQRITAPTGVD